MRPLIERILKNHPDGRPYTFAKGIQRGMIFWATVTRSQTIGSEQHDRRPWLIVSAEELHARLAIVQAVPLTTSDNQDRFPKGRIEILPNDVIPIPGQHALKSGEQLALTEQLRVLSHERLEGDPVARVSARGMAHVEMGIKYVLRMP